MLTRIPTIIRVSDLRKNLSRYLSAAKDEPQVVTTDRGGEARVIIDQALYNSLVEAYEDQQDSAELSLLIHKEEGSRVSWKKVRPGT